MESAIEQSVFNNTRCYTCGALVYAVEKKMTSNHVRAGARTKTSSMHGDGYFQIYHSRCFRCRICKRNLTGSTLNEEGDDIYCESQSDAKENDVCKTVSRVLTRLLPKEATR
jgi:LIM domain